MKSLLLFAAVACVFLPVAAIAKKPTAKDKCKCNEIATAGAGPTTFAEKTADYCRIGHEYTLSPNLATLVVPLRWKIVKPTNISEFASQADYHYEIVEEYFSNAVPTSPAFRLEYKDRVTLKANASTIDLVHERGDPKSPTPVSNATLAMHASGLWAEGTAYDTKGNPTGTIRAYLREEAKICKHSYYSPITNTTPCRRVLFEYFDKNDSLSVKDTPKTEDPDRNVFEISHAGCANSLLLETSDGEGHEGPNKH
ncbi:hypothetical protein ACFJIW_20040 [Tahibacter sp. UC22_41]|uniref:hypothetical protein n=1 Tax=Tahibacter sp. UC22_41 TaxID=3350178 RepID=UPI0036DB966E